MAMARGVPVGKKRLRRKYRQAIRAVGTAIFLATIATVLFVTVDQMTRDPNLHAPPPD